MMIFLNTRAKVRNYLEYHVILRKKIAVFSGGVGNIFPTHRKNIYSAQ